MNILADILSSPSLNEVFGHSLVVNAVCAFVLSFLIVLIAGPWGIRKLISLKLGQPVRTQEEVHKLAELHGKKAGTPTMGGLLIVAGTIISTLVFAEWNRFVMVCLFAMSAMTVLGFMDDYRKVQKKNSDGLSAKKKLVVQTLIGLAGISILYFMPHDSMYSVQDTVSKTFIPFYGTVDLGWLCIILGALTMVGTSNAVNLTDGLDGLASSCTVTTGIFYAVAAWLASNFIAASNLDIPYHPMLGQLAIFVMALVGAVLGFLWYNCYPARVFMGDTGSLAIGGALGMVAICLGLEFLMVIAGGIFVIEGTSVVLQIISFQSTGKRIFRMTPIHHHFELGGWKETQVIARFWMLGVVFAFISLLALISA